MKAKTMSVHDQVNVLDMAEEILHQIEFYDEDECPVIFNELSNAINELIGGVKKTVKISISENIGDVCEDSIKNILF